MNNEGSQNEASLVDNFEDITVAEGFVTKVGVKLPLYTFLF